MTDKLPKFNNEDEEAKFWVNHSTADYAEDFVEVKEKITLDDSVKIRVQKERKTKKQIAFRIEEEYIDALKEFAQKKAIGYQTLMRMWIVERLNREKMKK